MNRRAWLLVPLALALPAGIGAGCGSSTGNGPGPTADGGCEPGDASVTALLAIDAGSLACQACVHASCTTAITACGSDCTCNASALQALACLEGLGPSATLASATACVAAAQGASDPTLGQVGTCLASCESACSGAVPDSGVTDASGVDSTVPPADAGHDTGTTDTGTDTSLAQDASDSAAPVDTGVDAPVDTGIDAPVDTGVDAPADTGSDAPADAGFDAPIEQADGGEPFYVVTTPSLGNLAQEGVLADFNGDLELDLALAGEDVASTFGAVVALGDGSGHFTFKATVPGMGNSPSGIAVGDFNHDMKVDLVAYGAGAGPCIALGNGDGTFGTASCLSVVSSVNAGVEVADFNGDGWDDIAAYSQPLDVFFNDHAGGFTETVVTTSVFTARFAVADLNNDGFADLQATDNFPLFYLSNGDAGTFTASGPAATEMRSVAIGDLDHNGLLDVVSGNDQSSNGDMGVNLQFDGGTWGAQVKYSTTASIVTPVIADFNGDTHLDVAVGRGGNSVDIYLGVGNGALNPPGNYPLPAKPTALLTGDVNRDGWPDIVVVTQGFFGASATTLLNAK